MGKNILIVTAILILLLALYRGWYLIKGYNRQMLYHDTKLVEALDCSTSFKEYDIDGLIKVERDSHLIGLKFDEPFTIDLDEDAKIRNSSGVIEAEIMLIDSNGMSYPFVYSGARNDTIIVFRTKDKLTHGLLFSRLRIRCNRSLFIRNILWTNYDIKDLK